MKKRPNWLQFLLLCSALACALGACEDDPEADAGFDSGVHDDDAGN